jgi:hypothetical protein
MPDFRPPGGDRMNRGIPIVIVLVIIAAVIAGVVAWKMRPPPLEPPVAATPAAPAEAPSAPVADQTEAYPAPPPVPASEAITAEGLPGAVEGLVGRSGVALFRLDDFARRFAATVDNLGRDRATSALWPVTPASGRFTVRTEGGTTIIAPENARRYTPYVELAERVDLQQVVSVYRRAYPLMQSAYEALGFPGRPFNDRLIRVVDHLIAAPEPTGPLEVHLPTMTGTAVPARPWVLYEFNDPALADLSAGQKIMVRVGLDNERRLKARLREFRARLVAGIKPES